MRDSNQVLCRMSLDLDGILHLTAVEKRTGLSKHIKIVSVLEAESEAEVEAARELVEELFASRWQDEVIDDEELEENAGDLEEDYQLIEGGNAGVESGPDVAESDGAAATCNPRQPAGPYAANNTV